MLCEGHFLPFLSKLKFLTQKPKEQKRADLIDLVFSKSIVNRLSLESNIEKINLHNLDSSANSGRTLRGRIFEKS